MIRIAICRFDRACNCLEFVVHKYHFRLVSYLFPESILNGTYLRGEVILHITSVVMRIFGSALLRRQTWSSFQMPRPFDRKIGILEGHM
jgi:hypothetical protein